MKHYEYVTVSIDHFIGAGSLEHREIIDTCAKRGFSYVGFVPVKISDYGKFKEIDLVFERETE